MIVLRFLFLGGLGTVFWLATLCELNAATSTPSPETTTAQPVAAPGEAGAARVQNSLKEVQQKAELEEQLKASLVEAYEAAIGHYESAKGHREREAGFQESIATLPDQVAEIKSELDEDDDPIPASEILLSLPNDLSLPDFDRLVAQEKAELLKLKNQLTEFTTQIADGKARPEALREQQAQIESDLASIDEALGNASAEGDVFSESVASAEVLRARKVERLAASAALEQEALSAPFRANLLTARRDLVQREIGAKERRVSILEEELGRQRREAAANQLEAAEATRLQTEGKHPLLAQIAKENEELSNKHAGLLVRIDEELKDRLTSLETEISGIKEDFDRAKSQIDLVGLSDSLAVLLLDQWRRLPNVRSNRAAIAVRKRDIGKAGLDRFQYEEQQRRLPLNGDESALRAWAQRLYPKVELTGKPAVEWTEVGELVEAQDGYLLSLLNDCERLLVQLGQLDLQDNKRISLVEEYRGFLEQRLLWVPSTTPLKPQSLRDAGTSLGWLVSARNRTEMERAFRSLLDDRPVYSALLGLLLLVSLASRPVVKQRETTYANGVRRISTDSFALTLKAAFTLLLQSAPFAGVMALVGWHLLGRESTVEVLRGLGVSLQFAAIYLFGMLVLLNTCRPKGLGQAHFRWPAKIAGMVRRQLFWFLPLVLVCTILIELSEELTDEYHRPGLGRLSLVVLLLAVAYLSRKTMRPDTGILSGVLAGSPKGWLFRFQRLWYWLLILIPLGLALLSIVGYHHTAVQLTRRGAITVSFLVGAFVIHQLIWRWFVAKERKLLLEKRLEQRRLALENAEKSGSSETTTIPEINEDEVDLRQLNEQTRRLLSSLITTSLLVGVWLIWSDVLPALNVLDSVKLWETEKLVGGDSVIQPVTLNHLALSFLIIIFTSVAVRNITGVLEIGILQNLPLAAGSRYAIVTVVQYGLVILSAVFVFNVLGFSLAQFGWMMAALSVGLGFGLQEVVANFVSGVILLAERPIRVGDIVTVSDISGIVTRIRIRATTITNWDRQELVVPNKEFITGRILNWTLSNTVNRIVIVVGVAYGSDTNQARELLLKVARDHELIMDDPGPMATFEGFDDSTLRLILRCYLPNLDNRLSVITALHTEIDRVFQEAGLEISFPQRDLHVRSVPPELFQPGQAMPGATNS